MKLAKIPQKAFPKTLPDFILFFEIQNKIKEKGVCVSFFFIASMDGWNIHFTEKFSADLLTLTKEILNKKLHFLSSESRGKKTLYFTKRHFFHT